MTDRPIAGYLRYTQPPEVGTIVGQAWTREMLIVIDTDDRGRTVLGYASDDEQIARTTAILAGDAPRSVIEHRTLMKEVFGGRT